MGGACMQRRAAAMSIKRHLPIRIRQTLSLCCFYLAQGSHRDSIFPQGFSCKLSSAGSTPASVFYGAPEALGTLDPGEHLFGSFGGAALAVRTSG